MLIELIKEHILCPTFAGLAPSLSTCTWAPTRPRTPLRARTHAHTPVHTHAHTCLCTVQGMGGARAREVQRAEFHSGFCYLCSGTSGRSSTPLPPPGWPACLCSPSPPNLSFTSYPGQGKPAGPSSSGLRLPLQNHLSRLHQNAPAGNQPAPLGGPPSGRVLSLSPLWSVLWPAWMAAPSPPTPPATQPRPRGHRVAAAVDPEAGGSLARIQYWKKAIVVFCNVRRTVLSGCRIGGPV